MTTRAILSRSATTLLLLCTPAFTALEAQRLPAAVAARFSRATFAASQVQNFQSPLPPSPKSNSSSTRRDVLTVGSDRMEKVTVGAGAGLLGGAVLGSEIANRCRPVASVRCTAKGRRIRYIVGFGLLGAVVGGATGAVMAEQ